MKNDNNKNNTPEMNTFENNNPLPDNLISLEQKDYSMELIKEEGKQSNATLTRVGNPDRGFEKTNVIDIRDRFETDYVFLINDKYRYVDREDVVEKLIDNLQLTEGQAILLIAAANCDSGDRIPPYATADNGEEYDLAEARRELHGMKLLTLYDDAMVVDWLWLSNIVRYHEEFTYHEEDFDDEDDEEDEEEIKH